LLGYAARVRSARIGELGQAPVVDETGEPAAAAAGETLVTVEAVALNPLDLTVGAGAFYGGHPPLPYAIGCEAAGRIEDGSPVYLFGDGRGVSKPGFAVERVAVPHDLPLPLPSAVDPAVAAAAGIAGIAGWVAVAWKAQVGPGDRVLVLGASGAVGLVALQAAKLLGAVRVVAAGRDPARLGRAAELGADRLVALGDVDALADAFDGEGFTVCIDPLWGEPLAEALAAAAPLAREGADRARPLELRADGGGTRPRASGAARARRRRADRRRRRALSARARRRGVAASTLGRRRQGRRRALRRGRAPSPEPGGSEGRLRSCRACATSHRCP
jgi:NADPH:quinone reductase